MDITERDFFASANSGKGFINHFDNIFSGLEHHYIIKGGPGTGKSSLMKHIAKKALQKGMSVEYYHCSSDPESLDGIIINDISIGITDGTAPHVADPSYPGAFDEIINLGVFWDKSFLKQNKQEIIKASNAKAKTFGNAYAYLSSALKVENIIDSMNMQFVNASKMLSAARRITDRIPVTKSETSIRLTEGITMDGYRAFSPYLYDADKIYNIKDRYGIAHIFLEMIDNGLQGQKKILSYDPLDMNKINMIYLPESKKLFTVNKNEGMVINTERFICNDVYRDLKANIRQAQKNRAELLLGAYTLLSEIKKMHFSLEELYINAMDFTAKEEYQNQLVKEIFS